MNATSIKSLTPYQRYQERIAYGMTRICTRCGFLEGSHECNAHHNTAPSSPEITITPYNGFWAFQVGAHYSPVSVNGTAFTSTVDPFEVAIAINQHSRGPVTVIVRR